jgi:hypothetical protein
MDAGRSSMLVRSILVAVAGALLLTGSVLVFQILDSRSHSNSDTLRPFLLTMGPVWLVAVLAATVLLRDGLRRARRSAQPGGQR